MTAPTDVSAERPPAWHPDPWRRHQLRFHDGRLWTEHVSDAGIASLDSAPVADLERSRPREVVEAPPTDEVGARVVDVAASGPSAAGEGLDAPLLLLDDEPDDHGSRSLRLPDDEVVGSVIHRRASLLTRAGRRVVSSPSRAVTHLEVRAADGSVVLKLARPGRRTARTVDVRGADGAVGVIAATTVRTGLHAAIRDASGTEVGALAEDHEGTDALVVHDPGGARVARLTPVWDIPGARQHLPPGVNLLDRRRPDGSAGDVASAPLLLAAVLSPVLLNPPPPPGDDR